MIKMLSPRKVLLILGFLISIQTFASFVDNGSVKKQKKEISLKNFSKNSYKSTAYPSFRLSNFHFTGSSDFYQMNANNFMLGQSVIRMQNGNTTYVYPYKYKVKIPLFKTPTAPVR